MKEIDIEKWTRKALYECFSVYDNPIFAVNVRLDVTKLVEYTKRTGTSFFTNFLFVVMKCLNRIEEFRIRIHDGKVVLHEVCNPSCVVMNKTNTIINCRMKFKDDYEEFYRCARSNIEEAKNSDLNIWKNNKNETDLFYISTLPWLDFVNVSNPYHYENKELTSIPRLIWGKYVENQGRYEMSFGIEAHHALIDGYPVSKGILAIQKALDDIENFLQGKENER